jgi:hypothetical protein
MFAQFFSILCFTSVKAVVMLDFIFDSSIDLL